MVLNLVVLPAEGEVGEHAAADVARSENLPAQEIEFLVLTHNGHAFVVGGERGSQIDPEQALLATRQATACTGESTANTTAR